jgi:hypothetical protein
MPNARVVESWKLPLRFQRKVWDVKQFVAELKSLQIAPDKMMHEAGRIKFKI